ncbi:MAG TPA: ABC transporter permease [Candidatus Polarisedimenticolaceae bacterium]|nr:ABC transporter permease [Candidatus Polarisedimenticolaceae bacterium]
MKGKTWIVVRREFWGTVRRPSWLIGTFGMPVFVGLYAGIIFLIGSAAAKMDKPTGKAGVVDHAGIVRFEQGPSSMGGEIPAEAKQAMDTAIAMAGSSAGPAAGMVKTLLSGTQFVPFATEDEALAALARKEIGAVYVVPADYLATGKIVAYDASESILSEGKLAQAPLRRLLVRSLAADRVAPETVERILDPLQVKTLTRGPEGAWVERGVAELIRRLGVPLGFTMMLLISILVSSGTLIQGVSEEKENRVIEVILSSIDARSLLLGKLLGLGAAGLLQLAIWLTMALFPLFLFVAGLALSPMIVVLCLAYFVLAFLLFGTLITATGVLGTNAKDMQQYGMFWSIACAVPMFFLEIMLREPNGTAARILSIIPLTSPVTMMLRIGARGVAWWEIPLTLAILALSVWLALRFAARVFRTALLMYGKRPTIPEVFRWMRQA